MSEYTSNARWPEGTVSGMLTTRDTHSTLEGAKSVCARLRDEGFGGMGVIFPISTWVSTPKELEK